jgi:hypothetical protein
LIIHIGKKKQKHNRKIWNVQISRINSLVQLFDDTYEVYKVEFVMKLKKNKKVNLNYYLFKKKHIDKCKHLKRKLARYNLTWEYYKKNLF